MPVVVTGADTDLGAAIVAALSARPGEVRALVSGSSVLHDAQRLSAALAGAHTLVHLDLATLPGLLDGVEPPPRIVTTTAVTDAPPPAFVLLEALAHELRFELVVLRPLGGDLTDPSDLVAAVVAADAARETGARVVVRDIG